MILNFFLDWIWAQGLYLQPPIQHFRNIKGALNLNFTKHNYSYFLSKYAHYKFSLSSKWVHHSFCFLYQKFNFSPRLSTFYHQMLFIICISKLTFINFVQVILSFWLESCTNLLTLLLVCMFSISSSNNPPPYLWIY